MREEEEGGREKSEGGRRMREGEEWGRELAKAKEGDDTKIRVSNPNPPHYPTHHTGTVGSCCPAPRCSITRSNTLHKLADTTTQQRTISSATYPVPAEEGARGEECERGGCEMGGCERGVGVRRVCEGVCEGVCEECDMGGCEREDCVREVCEGVCERDVRWEGGYVAVDCILKGFPLTQ